MTLATRTVAERIARGQWTTAASCTGQPGFCDQPHTVITATCTSCAAITDCARLERAELLCCLASSDDGTDRVYAGHQLSELVSVGRTSKSKALAMLDMAGGLTKQRSNQGE